jgi:hypothetical protein
MSFSAFSEGRRVARGSLAEIALAVKAVQQADPAAAVLVLDDDTGRIADLDLRGEDAEILGRLEPAAPPRGRGRPKLGVTAREVTLLPRQWDWLATQPGGASATLRRLVDEARRGPSGEAAERRARQDAAYRAMHALAGDLPGYEEALRALYADDHADFEAAVAPWPPDLKAYALQLAFGSA